MAIKRPFYLGNLKLSSNVLCAPLAGCTDLPFRKMAIKFRPGLIYCEMVKMDALIRKNAQTMRILDYEPSMHPIGAQICGSKPAIAGISASIIEDLGFDIIDLNCGCPVDKVTKDGSGSGMLQNPDLIGEVISKMVAAVKIPVTVKIRTGWDSHSIVAPEVTKIAESAGAKAITIHGRTRAQAYRGPANWDPIAECKKVAGTIKVIGNGDINDPLSAEKIFMQTGCDGILIARGMLGTPWIIDDIYRHFDKESPITRGPKDLRDALLEAYGYIASYQEERKALLDFRRVGSWYLRSIRGVKALRETINRAQSIPDVYSAIDQFNWEEADITQSQGSAEEDKGLSMDDAALSCCSA